MAPSTFKVIIVGGGPMGLLAAHTLSKAGIDFVVLEVRDTVKTHQGASIGIGPQILRIWDQIGILDVSRGIKHPLVDKYIVTHDGLLYGKAAMDPWVEENHGHTLHFAHRADILDMLYSTLTEADKAHVLTNKKITEIQSDDTGVVVKCDDGSTYEGSLVLGADGVHSQVRQLMRELALKENPKAAVNKERPFVTTYRCLFGYVPLSMGMKPSNIWECHGKGASTQAMVGKDKMWFFVYEKLDKPTQERHRYTEKERDQFAERYGHLYLGEKLQVKDVYPNVTQAVLSDLEEGSVDHYTWGRIALVGDAGTKQTPNAGIGFNSGAQDVVLLSNLLYDFVNNKKLAPGSPEESAALSDLLAGYAKERHAEALVNVDTSGKATRTATWDNWAFWLLDRYVIPFFNLDKLVFSKLIGSLVAVARVLTYLPEKELVYGKLRWKHTGKE